MDQWTHAIYDATGIPLSEEALSLPSVMVNGGSCFTGTRFWSSVPNPTPLKHSTRRYAQRCRSAWRSDSPRSPRFSASYTPWVPPHPAIRVTVVNVEGRYAPMIEHAAPERDWPHFVLRLSTNGFDVEVDLNPYTPDTPYDIDDLRRQANVMFHVVQRP